MKDSVSGCEPFRGYAATVVRLIARDNREIVSFHQRLGWRSVPNVVMQKRLRP